MKRSIISLAVLVALLVGALPVHALEGITVKSDRYVSKFPQEIVFSLEASAPSDIKKITLNYSLGRGTATAYGYPEFTPGREVKAEFSLKTGGAKYVPPGAKVVYHYVVEDASGNELKTDEHTFMYEDIRFQWDKVSRDLVTVFYYGNAKASAESILNVSLATADRMGKAADVQLTDPVKIMVYNSKAEIDVALPFQSEATTRDLVTLGEAHSEYDLILMLGSGPREQVEETAAHEFMHLISHQATDSAFSTFPIWVNEGLSVYAQGQLNPNDSYLRSLDAAIKADLVQPLRWLANRPGKPEEVILFYGQSYAVTRFMIEKYGAEKMRDLLAAFKAGNTLDDALQKVYGLSVDGLDAAWRASVGLAPLPTVVPTEPGAAKKSAVPTLVPSGAKPKTSQSSATATPKTADATPAPTTETEAETSSNLPVAALAGVALLAAVGLGALVLRRR